MQVFQNTYQNDKWDQDITPEAANSNLLIYFGSKSLMQNPDHFESLKKLYPHANIVGCSTGGEIIGEDVSDDTLVSTAIKFDNTETKVFKVKVDDKTHSKAAGLELGEMLKSDSLAGVMILSEGLEVNGSELVKGLKEKLGSSVPITGGLAGDGSKFEDTLVTGNSTPEQGSVVAIGFYGNKFHMKYGSYGGWDTFGPERLVTRSEGNVLYELDGQPALALYKKYLGDEADNLPGSALLFPLTIYAKGDKENALVRTVLSIDEETQGVVFAGDIPEGHYAQLMRGDMNNLVEGASIAAKTAIPGEEGSSKLAILISCIGRKILMGQQVADEVEAVNDTLGDDTNVIGFYSYGEICPLASTSFCELHNQTMTITTITESES